MQSNGLKDENAKYKKFANRFYSLIFAELNSHENQPLYSTLDDTYFHLINPFTDSVPGRTYCETMASLAQ